jgi:hypothetical protein
MIRPVWLLERSITFRSGQTLSKSSAFFGLRSMHIPQNHGRNPLPSGMRRVYSQRGKAFSLGPRQCSVRR